MSGRVLLCCVCGDATPLSDGVAPDEIAALAEAHGERCPGSPYANGAPAYQAWTDHEATL